MAPVIKDRAASPAVALGVSGGRRMEAAELEMWFMCSDGGWWWWGGGGDTQTDKSTVRNCQVWRVLLWYQR